MDERRRMRRVWRNILERCYNRRCPEYHNYGGRGIKLFDAWHDFDAFYEDVVSAIGLRPTKQHSLDRIDNDRGYEPGNLRWATPRQQNWNRRPIRWIDLNGERLPHKVVAERLGIDDATLRTRIRRHGIDKALRMRRRSIVRRSLVVNGERMSVRQAAKVLGISDVALLKRIKKYGPEKAVEMGPRRIRRITR